MFGSPFNGVNELGKDFGETVGKSMEEGVKGRNEGICKKVW
jgi:hypothetical protein